MLQKTPASNDSKCGRRVTARESWNLSISAMSEQALYGLLRLFYAAMLLRRGFL